MRQAIVFDQQAFLYDPEEGGSVRISTLRWSQAHSMFIGIDRTTRFTATHAANHRRALLEEGRYKEVDAVTVERFFAAARHEPVRHDETVPALGMHPAFAGR
jgi:hypothetical protein